MAFTVLVVFSFFGLSVDAGSWYMAHAWTQNQADAAAHAAALDDLSDAAAVRTTAERWLAKNGIAEPDHYRCAQVTPGRGLDWFALVDDGPGGVPDGQMEVVVCLQRTVPAAFAGLVGINTVTVSARARATIVAGQVALVE